MFYLGIGSVVCCCCNSIVMELLHFMCYANIVFVCIQITAEVSDPTKIFRMLCSNP